MRFICVGKFKVSRSQVRLGWGGGSGSKLLSVRLIGIAGFLSCLLSVAMISGSGGVIGVARGGKRLLFVLFRACLI